MCSSTPVVSGDRTLLHYFFRELNLISFLKKGLLTELEPFGRAVITQNLWLSHLPNSEFYILKSIWKIGRKCCHAFLEKQNLWILHNSLNLSYGKILKCKIIHLSLICHAIIYLRSLTQHLTTHQFISQFIILT